MPFVKLDTGIIDSTLWIDFFARNVFFTALAKARPVTLDEPEPVLGVEDDTGEGWSIPAGNYGFVAIAGSVLVQRTEFPEALRDQGMAGLVRLCSPEKGGRSTEFEGRRMVRIKGGFLVLNYARYREKDMTSAERSKRWRERSGRNGDTRDDTGDTRDETARRDRHACFGTQAQGNTRVGTHVEGEAEGEGDGGDGGSAHVNVAVTGQARGGNGKDHSQPPLLDIPTAPPPPRQKPRVTPTRHDITLVGGELWNVPESVVSVFYHEVRGDGTIEHPRESLSLEEVDAALTDLVRKTAADPKQRPTRQGATKKVTNWLSAAIRFRNRDAERGPRYAHP